MFGRLLRRSSPQASTTNSELMASASEGTSRQRASYYERQNDSRYEGMGQGERAWSMLRDGRWVPPMDRLEAAEHEAGLVRGRHHTQWSHEVASLKREQRYDEALALLHEIIAATESQQAVENANAPVRAQYFGRPVSEHRARETAPGWTNEAAIIYRKLKDYESEIAVIDRWEAHAGDRRRWVGATHAKLLERRVKARELLAKSR
ncbi:hypothetical protein O2V63_10595 [Modestobacter sp. VKM Ac-2977]|uniref:hypothetical protein n=1 Tax=Modestobacter sp. VKM Ac-2977 TaxID=3004131 RepID=UPI0022AA06D6|nr:hypothetical protein [Modestobacter sp. VKM Ac-2977]MCZ2820778.1 hypothetical protein [Modestobacter sp. VKM Ac-2977]